MLTPAPTSLTWGWNLRVGLVVVLPVRRILPVRWVSSAFVSNNSLVSVLWEADDLFSGVGVCVMMIGRKTRGFTLIRMMLDQSKRFGVVIFMALANDWFFFLNRDRIESAFDGDYIGFQWVDRWQCRYLLTLFLVWPLFIGTNKNNTIFAGTSYYHADGSHDHHGSPAKYHENGMLFWVIGINKSC